MACELEIYLPDAHVPFQDKAAVADALAFVAEYQPKRVWVLGDWFDFYAISRFSRDPKRRLSLQAEIDEGRELLAELRDLVPKASIMFLRGNHEMRLGKYLWGTAPELSCLRSLHLPELLGFDALHICYVARGIVVEDGLVVKHGNIVRRKAGYSVTGEIERAGTSVVMAHTHRLAQIHRTTYAGTLCGIEAGCLCSLNADYLEGQVADWQHGLAYREGDAWPQIVPIGG